jgi:hypothetical protein
LFLVFATLAVWMYFHFMQNDRLSRLFWWGDGVPADRLRTAAQVMVFGNLDDMHEVRKRFGEEVFGEVLNNPPRGLFDPKSWSYWHRKLGREVPRLPAQALPWPAA